MIYKQNIYGNNVIQSFKIPISLCQLVLQKKLVKPFALYLILKTHGSGKLKINRSVINAIAHQQGVNQRTIKNNLARLCELNWTGFNPKSSILFVRGFDSLLQTVPFD